MSTDCIVPRIYEHDLDIAQAHVCYRTASHFYTHCYRPNQKAAGVWQLYNRIATCWHQCAVIYIIYIISEEASIFAPQRLRFYRALGVAACTVGKVRASTVFMFVCSMFRPSDFLLFVKNGFVVGVRCQGNREPPADGATTPLSQRYAWLALPKRAKPGNHLVQYICL